ncbi:MAG: phosphoribosylaminoimidazolesuccinocarboxamide synthase [Saprospiraceae bacterium]|nr:phosphoribosylaminoimidazolesuccinocarboxamide synthase [Saprospiraceae bacterium]
MLPEEVSIQSTDFKFKNLIGKYQGKVRDVYDIGDLLIMIATDRISAFDHILPRPIPSKGQVLNQISQYFLESVRDICPVWLTSVPDPNVSIGHKCKPIAIEMVVRGYLAGHAWRTYQSGQRILCGELLPDHLKEGQAFDQPIITPTTKASEGHDQDISYDELIKQKIVSKDILDEMYRCSLLLYQRGQQMASDKGLILVDTKYEFGLHQNKLTLMDEIHTPDSSRYYLLEGYEERLNSNEPQKQLSKEFVREWLIRHQFQGLDEQFMPHFPDGFVWEISDRYIQLYEKITGTPFVNQANPFILNRIQKNLQDFLI